MARGKRNKGSKGLDQSATKRLGRTPPVILASLSERARLAVALPKPLSVEERLGFERAYYQSAFRRNPVARFQARGQALLFQRLGHLNPVRQDKGFAARRAPERRGFWAFPWPAGDIGFFAGHKWDEVVPKRLREASLAADWESYREIEDRDERERRRLEHEALCEERERWIRDEGPKALPLRRFWVPFDCELYSHLAADGRRLGMNDWQRLTTSQFLAAARAASPSYGSDHLEVFIPRL